MIRILAAYLLVLAMTALAVAEATKPNILFIVCDDLNTHVSPSGYDPIHTPTLATLAKEGMTFGRAYCQYPVCGPSRASLLSGLYPESTGVLDNKADLRQTRPGTVTMPQHFKRHGYWTASVGKVFHSPRHEPGDEVWHVHQRFDNHELPVVTTARAEFERQHGSVDRRQNRAAWRKRSKEVAAGLNAQTPPGHGRSGLSDEQHKDGKNVRQVLQWLDAKSYGDKPFFIALGIQKPHVPFLAPDKYFDLYPTDSIRFREYSSDLWETIPRDAISGRYKAFGFELGVENDTLRREYMQAYHACISFIDAQLALVMETLKEAALWDDTIIVFTSDHGYHLGDHFMWGKVTLFDIGTRVPCIVRVPGVTKPGSQSEAMVELIDVFPTLTELASIETPVALQGTSLVPLLRDASLPGQQLHAYSVVRRRDNLGYALRNQKWRYTKWPNGEELYDLKRDPAEQTNLATQADHAAKLRQFRLLLEERRRVATSQREADAE